MINELSTKLYKLDFKELIDNATNKEYWTKKWKIYEYDTFYVEFLLSKIDIIDNKLEGRIILNGGTVKTNARIYSYITIPLQEENFNKIALEKELVGKVEQVFLEQGCIDLRCTDEYYELMGLEDELEGKLKIIAEEHLDYHNVSNKDIREVYIDNYVSDNSVNYTADYVNSNKYKKFVSHRATFAYIMGFNDKAEWIIKEAERDDNLQDLLDEAEELRQLLLEDDMSEYEDKLDNI